MPTTVLITGANRGIGRGLAEAFLSRPNHIVIAAVRNPETTTLKDFKATEGSKLILVKIENTSTTDPAAAVEQMRAAGITTLDIVIANAGISPVDALRKVEDMSLDQIRNLFEVNTLSYITLFQAVRPLLKAAAEGGVATKLLAISSSAGQIVDMEPNVPAMVGSYGVSKVALNFLVRRTHFENPWLSAWVMHPGFVQTDTGNATAQVLGMTNAPLTLEESVTGLLEAIDGATKEKTSGKFLNFDGSEIPY
ncbi:hypothetical protein N0V93_008207 [Gnomoniopsis smithogilvyi]|uniref:Uncharacterized protein n=1 Tax=Gnomoniopsis smithogilvyi TaxID=1191159 RepID=A0A9W8YM94_9PEZI|nr:hypothetical protein N0V93_008207 [Gnomoniopsis smithogilvyi]